MKSYVSARYQIWIESDKKFHLVMLQVKNKRFALLEFGNLKDAKKFVNDFIEINKEAKE